MPHSGRLKSELWRGSFKRLQLEKSNCNYLEHRSQCVTHYASSFRVFCPPSSSCFIFTYILRDNENFRVRFPAAFVKYELRLHKNWSNASLYDVGIYSGV